MKRHLPAFFLVAFIADQGANVLRDGLPSVWYLAIIGVAGLLLSGYPFAAVAAHSDLVVDTGKYGPRLLVALAVTGVVGLVGFWAVRGPLSGEEELIARLALFTALVPLSARVANHAPVAGEPLPDHGRYWGIPWEDRETVQKHSEK